MVSTMALTTAATTTQQLGYNNVKVHSLLEVITGGTTTTTAALESKILTLM